MPQMNPMNWMMIFCLILVTFIYLLMMTYFSTSNKIIPIPQSNPISNSKKNLKW
uniref:ATP synthase F0 subunit 8 n=1 Tax=Neoseiulus womersleyi TaxID=322050 RepID=A0A8F6U2S8_9ACAR|nr:ATP synthase F0 subunit 8 [Neoseiulus womersleyi]